MAGASPAHGVALQFVSSLAIAISPSPLVAPIVISGSGTAMINGSGAGGHLTGLAVPPGVFASSNVVVTFTTPVQGAIAGIDLTVANAPGHFAGVGASGTFGGVMPLSGIAKLCLFANCSAAVSNLNVPLSVVGAGGTAFVDGSGVAMPSVTVIGAPWTTGTIAIGTATAMGRAFPTSYTGAPSGQVELVTPIFISTSDPIALVPSFAFAAFHFLPEPGTAVLVGSGIAGLVAFGRTRGPRS